MSRIALTFFLLASMVLSGSCDRERDCPPQICTQQFVSVGLSFTDQARNPLPVRMVRVTNMRTGLEYPSEPPNHRSLTSTYTILSDSEKETLSAQGDIIRVTAEHPATGLVKTAELVIAGGKCACHIQKLSGPDQVTFDLPDQISSK